MPHNIEHIILWVVVLLVSLCIHEYSHAWVAYKRGDPTAKNLGRLTLNPLAHADLIGTFLLPLFCIMSGIPGFGWAKPVPVDSRNLKGGLRDMSLVAAAGPLSNVFLAVLATVLLSTVIGQPPTDSTVSIQYFCLITIQLNLVLAIFNLLPFPPLDGYRIVQGILPTWAAVRLHRIEGLGGILLMVLFFSGGLRFLLIPVQFCYQILINVARG